MRPHASSPNELGCGTSRPTAGVAAGFARSTRAQARRAVVAVEVAAEQRRQPGVAHDVAAGDRAVAVAAVRLLEHRRPRPGAARRVASGPRARPRARPAVVGGEPDVDLLVGVLADVADHELPGRAVEREAPRVAQPDARRSPAPARPGRAGSACRAARPGPARARTGCCPPPPSPVPSHSLPSGPNCSWPPLWFSRLVVRDRQQQPPVAGSATSGSAAERRYSRTWISPRAESRPPLAVR